MKLHKMIGAAMLGGVLTITVGNTQAETLREAIQEMLTTHPEVKSSSFNTLGRKEEVRQAKSGYLPTLDFNAGYGVQEVQEPIDDTLNPQLLTLSLRQNVFAGMATVNEVNRQKARVRSAAYTLQGTSENTALRTAEVYLNVLRQEELLRLAEENLNTHLRIADQIKMRSDSGVASRADSEQVAGRVSLAEANVVVTRTNLVDAHSNYLAVVGHMPGDLQRPESPEAMMPPSLEQALDDALKQHPTLKSANADLDARHEQHDVAAAPYLPIVDIEVDQNWHEDVDLDEGKEHSLVALVRLRYNLFRGFRDQARRAETAYLISEAREIRNNTHRQVVESLRLSWMAHKAVQDRIKYLEQRVNATVETAKSYTNQFNLGKRTLLDVLDTEAEVIDAKRALVEAQFDGLFSQYRILGGMGMMVKSFDLEWPKESQVDEEETRRPEDPREAGVEKESKIKIGSEIKIIDDMNSYPLPS